MTEMLRKEYVEHAKRVQRIEESILEVLESLDDGGGDVFILEEIEALRNILSDSLGEYIKFEWPPFEE